MDQAERIEPLKREVRQPTMTAYDRLTADGVPLPSPEDMSDAAIGAVLWRVIIALAKHRVFLKWTNHLSDRELYAVLWRDVLREEWSEETPVIAGSDPGAWHVDLPGDDPESTNFLTYYASEKDREDWKREFPDVVLPARQTPQYDRDDNLPGAWDDPPFAEAREWLQATRNPSALATNRFGVTAAALRFVERLYAAGASCVMVDHIVARPHDDGELYADELIVILPDDARRRSIFELIEHEGRPDTVDDQGDVMDQGCGSVRLWWD